MRQLAKTLLILGSVAACERASEVGDTTRRPERTAAQPLVDPVGRPAVGNIGQSGRPAAALPIVRNEPIVRQEPIPPAKPRARARPRPRAPVAPVAPVVPKAPDLQLQTERVNVPLLNREGRAATGNVPRRTAGPSYEERQERARLASEPQRDTP